MLRLGFQVWIDLIIKCMSSMSYRVKVNGNLSASFQLEHGLRQGNPQSPFLFLLCAEGFSALLNKAERDWLDHGGSEFNRMLQAFLIFYLPTTL